MKGKIERKRGTQDLDETKGHKYIQHKEIEGKAYVRVVLGTQT